jgi:hypothetical protein
VNDAAGRHLQRVGRKGWGPGEFQRPDHLLRLAGDTIAVWDAAGPVSLFDDKLRYIRREPGNSRRLLDLLGWDNAMPTCGSCDWAQGRTSSTATAAGWAPGISVAGYSRSAAIISWYCVMTRSVLNESCCTICVALELPSRFRKAMNSSSVRL